MADNSKPIAPVAPSLEDDIEHARRMKRTEALQVPLGSWKPCPFCGSMSRRIRPSWQVECLGCFAEGPKGDSPREAEQLWLRRIVRLTSFTVDQRIRVVHPDHPLYGETGTVRKTRRPQDQAWVEMDRDLPGDLRTFPANDTRHERFTLLWPSECAEVPNEQN